MNSLLAFFSLIFHRQKGLNQIEVVWVREKLFMSCQKNSDKRCKLYHISCWVGLSTRVL